MRLMQDRLSSNLAVTYTTAWKKEDLEDKHGTSTNKAIYMNSLGPRQSCDGETHRTMDGSRSTLSAERRR